MMYICGIAASCGGFKTYTMLVKNETGSGLLTESEIKILIQAGIVPKDTPAEQVAVFAAICKERGLSAFSKEIYLVGYGGKYTPIVGINGLRKVADRTGKLGGVSDAMFDLQPNGTYKTAAQFTRGEKPVTCTITVVKIVSGMKCEFTATVRNDEFNTNSGKWNAMPFQMLMKVAEAHALRKGFSDVLGGLNAEEEMGAITGEVVQEAVVVEVPLLEPSHKYWQRCINALLDGTQTIETLQKLPNFILNDANKALLIKAVQAAKDAPSK